MRPEEKELRHKELEQIYQRKYEELKGVKVVYMAVIGDINRRLPYGAKGRIKRHGQKRSLVDFGKIGTFRVPNMHLKTTKPDPSFEKTVKEALGIWNQIAKEGL